VFLDQNFPPNANVDLILELSKDAAAGEIEIILGDNSVSGQMAEGLNSVNVKFTNDEPLESIVIRAKEPLGLALGKDSKFVRVLWGLAGK
jgi:hypothetical protein